MTAVTLTLADFLLARIAEDEESANNWLRFDVRGGIPGNYSVKERVLAECETKRRIIWIHRVKVIPPYDTRGELIWCQCLWGAWPCPTLHALALPYAEHPDYRDEWRP